MAKAKQTHHKYFADQFDDEDVLYVFKHHPVLMRVGLVIGMMGPLVGVLPSLFIVTFPVLLGGLAAGLVLGGLLMLPSWISWNFSVFIITNQRFIQITQKGLFHRAVADIGLNQIQSVNYEISGMQETMLGFGTIKMQTYVGELVIHDVHHPNKLQKKIIGILRDQGITGASYPATTSQLANDDDQDEDNENTEAYQAA